MKLAKASKLREKLDNDRDEGEAKLDRKKYALTCYGRALYFVRSYLDSVREEKPINTAKVLRIIQDLVDISIDHKTHFLGLTTTKSDGREYLAYHLVNTGLMCIVFGAELGLTKPQLRDLAYIAMFHDAGMSGVPPEVLNKKGALSPDERAVVNRAPLVAIRNILQERQLNRSTLLRLVTTFEHRTDFGTAVRDAQGNIQMIMWTEMRNKFDPELLKVFMRVMAIQPIKALTKRQQNIAVGML